ncbi:S1 family peptidase [Frateuria aurantia]
MGLLLATLGLAAAGNSVADELPSAILPRIQASTFEVVVAKPTKDPLSYERALPLDQLPYATRKDKYNSLGTAFALGGNRYVTAAHVLTVDIGGLQAPPQLRDGQGHVFSIDKILQFSLDRDFVVFSLQAPPAVQATLDVETQPSLNQAVYAVGNALGEGVVIRDGLLTSATPEAQDGRWNWLRFSAAASPGNSGGPLLDHAGKIIGVVLMKSANENLNYALPIGDVLNAPPNLAVMDKRTNYRPEWLQFSQTDVFKQQFALPKSFADFEATYTKLSNDFLQAQFKADLANHADVIFPLGAGSNPLLHDEGYLNPFPALLSRRPDGVWTLHKSQASNSQLSGNGYLQLAAIGSTVLMHMRRPDSADTSQFYHQPRQWMDLLLKVMALNRSVGSESVRVTSLGEPDASSIHTDTYQRIWQVYHWPMAYINATLVSYVLPVPDGYVGLIKAVPASELPRLTLEMQLACDLLDVGYRGSLAQWQAFMKQTALLPGPIRNIQLGIDYGHQLSFSSKRFKLNLDDSLQAITPDSYLQLGLGYVADSSDPMHRKASLEVTDVETFISANDRARSNISRHIPPAADSSESARYDWQKLLQHKPPFDAVAYPHDDMTQISTVLGHANDTSGVLYTAFIARDGSVGQDKIRPQLDILSHGLQILEP